MTIELVYRVRCSGPCRGWLSTPDDYDLFEEVPLAALEPKPTAARAGMWPDEAAARRAEWAAGWSRGMCPDCGTATEAAPRREPHPTQADVDHAMAVLAKFEGQNTAAPPAADAPHKTAPCRTFVTGGTVWCCEEGETDCPCVCHEPGEVS